MINYDYDYDYDYDYFYDYFYDYDYYYRIGSIKTTTINALAYSQNEEYQIFQSYVEEFNKYSSINNLNITLNLELYTPLNITTYIQDYESMVEILLEKKTTKYDIFIYENFFNAKFSSYFLDLKEWLPKSHMEMYDNTFAKFSSMYNDKWVGLPLYLNFDMLYVNLPYLSKYFKKIPVTWNEFLEIGSYILNEEKKNNNTNLIGYTDLSCYNFEVCSLNEMIYSYRDSKDSSYPKLTSKSSIQALEMMKTIKNKFSTVDSDFSLNEENIIDLFSKENILFIKYWYYLPIVTHYKKVILPGYNNGVSASYLQSYNIAINSYSTNNARDAAIEAVTYITSREVQEKFTIEKGIISGIYDIYNKGQICDEFDCNLITSIQPINPIYSDKNNDYLTECKQYITDYLGGKKTASDTLNAIANLSKTYIFSINSDDYVLSFIVLMITIILSVCMLSSIIFIFIKKYESFFKFLSNDLWVIFIVGCTLILNCISIEYGEINSFKCHFKTIILSYGITCSLIPILHKIIEKFPVKSNLFSWISHHKYLFILFFYICDSIFNTLSFLSPYNVITVNNPLGYQFKKSFIQKREKKTMKEVIKSLQRVESEEYSRVDINENYSFDESSNGGVYKKKDVANRSNLSNISNLIIEYHYSRKIINKHTSKMSRSSSSFSDINSASYKRKDSCD
ncbi:periplasmic binding protein-like II [Anaeromyces robustus]|uniref:Periplasmic binding protein-like II n=1 Tax=Anaeromyces robustus TaxID=1754192 RepID=A0A1Y1WXB7_9FUNG|nr:periplasmic binding protein-like II [Anaeromyces robustus]|eukprot:ORX78209.1 periplasmic binding protein-like II [Anaeromyces robustus]